MFVWFRMDDQDRADIQALITVMFKSMCFCKIHERFGAGELGVMYTSKFNPYRFELKV